MAFSLNGCQLHFSQSHNAIQLIDLFYYPVLFGKGREAYRYPLKDALLQCRHGGPDLILGKIKTDQQ